MLQLCPEVKFAATPPTDGTLRRYMAHPAKYLFPIPDHMTYAQAALVEPFSVALAAVEELAEAALVVVAVGVDAVVVVGARA